MIEFEHVPRYSNSVAHDLAKLARASVQSVCLDELTISIKPLMVSDVRFITNGEVIKKKLH
jgi:hypothetical protein